MSNFHDDHIRCPECGMSPILALDDTPKRHQYTYQCPTCGYSSQSYDKFPKTDKAGSTRIDNEADQ